MQPLIAVLLLAALQAKGDEGESLFDGKALGKWKSTSFGGEGEVKIENGAIRVEMGSSLSGIHWTGPEMPKTNYEVSLEAQKVDGSDFFCGLVFPVGKEHCSFVAGGWGGGVVGLSSIDGMNASENETAKFMNFDKGRWYKIRLQVTPEKIQSWIDDKQVIDLELKDRKISLHPAVEASRPFGLATYETTSLFRAIRLKKLDPPKK
jgi:hypothetical protein